MLDNISWHCLSIPLVIFHFAHVISRSLSAGSFLSTRQLFYSLQPTSLGVALFIPLQLTQTWTLSPTNCGLIQFDKYLSYIYWLYGIVWWVLGCVRILEPSRGEPQLPIQESSDHKRKRTQSSSLAAGSSVDCQMIPFNFNISQRVFYTT